MRDVCPHTTDNKQPKAVCYLECAHSACSVLMHGILMQSSDSEFTTWCSLPRRWLNHCLIFGDMLIANIVVIKPIGVMLIMISTLIELIFLVQNMFEPSNSSPEIPGSNLDLAH